jgi:hypothetical protein
VRTHHLGVACLATVIAFPYTASAETTGSPPGAVSPAVGQTIVSAWQVDPITPAAIGGPGLTLQQTAQQPQPTPPGQPVQQGQAAQTAAGPDIGRVGIGAIGGLSDLEFGPSVRTWFTPRFGAQAHLVFSSDDYGPQDVSFIRFEPTVLVALGDFGEGQVNIRPYLGGGLRLVRASIGNFSDSETNLAAVVGAEFGFLRVPRFKVSGEVSLSTDSDFDTFDPPRAGPRHNGVRIGVLGHYFF